MKGNVNKHWAVLVKVSFFVFHFKKIVKQSKKIYQKLKYFKKLKKFTQKFTQNMWLTQPFNEKSTAEFYIKSFLWTANEVRYMYVLVL